MAVGIFSRKVMSHPVVTLDSVSRANVIVNILKGETHDGFPVVQQQTGSLDVIVFVIYFSVVLVQKQQRCFLCQ